MKLKIHTDLSLLHEGVPVEMLIPLIDSYIKVDETEVIRNGRFDEYSKVGSQFFELTSIEDCDVCLLPINYDVIENQKEFEKKIEPFIKKVEQHNKKILIFVGHDVLRIKIDVKNAIIFNSAINKSEQPKNVHAWPHFFEDFLDKYTSGDLQVRSKGSKPIVGFCGYAPPLNITMGREKILTTARLVANYMGIMRKFPEKIAHSYRARSIIGLQRSNKIVQNFRLKSNFAFGPQGMNTGNTTETNDDFRRNFVNNILESDYTLCIRGYGNNSVRFFETMCCGRIPIFVNTDSSLPFDNLIDWKNLCVWVEEKDIDRIADVVAEFHRNISEQDFIDLQRKLRKIWEDYLAPEGFFRRMDYFINS